MTVDDRTPWKGPIRWSADHRHAFGPWRTEMIALGYPRSSCYPLVRRCECGAKQVKQQRDD